MDGRGDSPKARRLIGLKRNAGRMRKHWRAFLSSNQDSISMRHLEVFREPQAVVTAGRGECTTDAAHRPDGAIMSLL